MERDWETLWQHRDTPWDRGEPSPFLKSWADTLSAPVRVLVPGCGGGHELLELARRGHDVWGVDLAPSALEFAASRLKREGLEAQLVEADILNWDHEVAFQAVYEQTCLCALPPDAWREYESRLWHWLEPGGSLAAAFMQSGLNAQEGPPYHCGLDEMRQLFEPSRWKWPEGETEIIPHPKGMYELALVLQRW